MYATGTKYNVPVKAGGNNTIQIHLSETVTVTFDPNDGSNTIHAKVQAGQSDKITAPSVPTRSGYIFDGWYKEAACTNQWDTAITAIKNGGNKSL